MKAYFFKTGTNVLLLCKVEEIRDNGETIRVRLLESNTMSKINTTIFANERESGLHKEGEIVQTRKENVIAVDLGMVQRIAIKAGYPGQVTGENVIDIVKSLAVNHTEYFAKVLESHYAKAVNQYDSSPETSNIYHMLTDRVDSIFRLLDIETDYPGLYPTFELDRNGKHLTEYSTLGALRQYNNFWGHW